MDYIGFIVRRKRDGEGNAEIGGRLKDALSFDIRIREEKVLGVYVGRNLFPGKFAEAGKIISQLRWNKLLRDGS